jgi:D-lactate dehydrogenase
LAGNLHFLLAQSFDEAAEVERYRRFMDGLADLVVGRYDGSLKAEHGTGRNIAPYVEQEWGERAMDLMRRVKAAVEPDGVLNPGVLLSDDPLTHVHNLKRMPPAHAIVDKCIECGFCERMCPSKGMTLSPRQRIVGWREISRRQAAGEETAAWHALYDYQGVDTCAACGLCSTVCPVSIDTGKLMRSLRGQRQGEVGRRIGDLVARHFAVAAVAARGGLAAGRIARLVLGGVRLETYSRRVRGALGNWLPVALSSMPNPTRLPPVAPAGLGDEVIYVPACISRVMGPPDGAADRRSLPAVVEALLVKAGFSPVRPPGIDGLCCGLPFDSRGQAETAAAKLDEMARAVLAAGPGLPVVMDASPCSLRLKEALAGRATVFDLPEFLHDHVLPRLDVSRSDRPVLLHLPCSLKRMGLDAKLRALAEACSERVSVSVGVNCCGFAGDKGLFNPELNEYALRHLCDDAAADGIGISSSRSCEIGLTRHGARSFQSIAYLLDACSTPRDRPHSAA